jgi:hypothetical protein
MPVTSILNGTVTTDGTEQTVGSAQTDDNFYTGYIDLSNNAAGDTVVIKIKVRVDSSDIICIQDTFTGAQAEPLYYFPPLPSTENFVVTIQKTGGTNRAYKYRIFTA